MPGIYQAQQIPSIYKTYARYIRGKFLYQCSAQHRRATIESVSLKDSQDTAEITLGALHSTGKASTVLTFKFFSKAHWVQINK